MKWFLSLAAVACCTMSARAQEFRVVACAMQERPHIFRKVEDIRIPKVDFRNITVAEALEFLRQRSRELDPDGHGVNFVLKEMPTTVPVAPLHQK